MAIWTANAAAAPAHTQDDRYRVLRISDANIDLSGSSARKARTNAVPITATYGKRGSSGRSTGRDQGRISGRMCSTAEGLVHHNRGPAAGRLCAPVCRPADEGLLPFTNRISGVTYPSQNNLASSAASGSTPQVRGSPALCRYLLYGPEGAAFTRARTALSRCRVPSST